MTKPKIAKSLNVGDTFKAWKKEFSVEFGYDPENGYDMAYRELVENNVEMCTYCAFAKSKFCCHEVACHPHDRDDKLQVYFKQI